MLKPPNSWPGRGPKHLALAFAALAIALCCRADEAISSSRQRILEDVRYLASDELEGRGIGTKGLQLAAEYVGKRFAEARLKHAMPDGSYFQNFDIPSGYELAEPNRLVIQGPQNKSMELQLSKDFVPLAFSKSGNFTAQMVFAGYGVTAPEYSYDDYEGINVEGKVVMVMRREPRQDAEPDPHAPFQGSDNTRHAALWSKANNAAQHGAEALIYVTDPYTLRSQPDELMEFGYAAGLSRAAIPVLHITYALADSIVGQAVGRSLADLEAIIDKDLHPQSRVLEGWSCSGQVTVKRQTTTVANVLGLLDGSGPQSDETIVIGAHYDHLGYGGAGSAVPGNRAIHNGADDNASGTAGVLELARRLARRPQPLRRRILFIAFTGEERGLLGSQHYVDHPVVPLEKTVAMVNLDMIGRLRNGRLMAFGVGTAKEFQPLLDSLNERHEFNIRGRASGFGPSDHTSFYKRRIPVLHFFTDSHADYHRPSDDWEKVSIEGIERVIGLVEELVVALADTVESPSYVAVPRSGAATGGGRRAYLGTIPSFGVDVDGVLLDGVAPGGPAEEAGLRGGDVLVELGKMPIHGLEDLQQALVKHKPGERVSVVVRRGALRITYPVTLRKRE